MIIDAVVNYLPSPIDIPPVKGMDSPRRTSPRSSARPSDDEPFSALAFKILNDPHGNLTFFRVYSGKVASGTMVLNSTRDKRERIGRILRMHANKREEVQEADAGNIYAAVGLRDTRTGDTLCDEKHPILLEQMIFPAPVISIAIEPKTKADVEKLGVGLQKLAAEDPSFRMHTDEETGQTIIAGMGELHLEIIVDRLKREFKVEANVGKPEVAYRETITQEGRRASASTPAVRRPRPVRPRRHGPRAAASAARASSSRTTSSAASSRGVHPGGREGRARGAGARRDRRLPAHRRAVKLTDGSYHEVDSSEMAFEVAASLCFQDGASAPGRCCSSRS